MIIEQATVFNAETFKDFLQKIIEKANVIDAKTNKTKEDIIGIGQCQVSSCKLIEGVAFRGSRSLELFFLQPYSPDINAIAMLWKKIMKEISKGHLKIKIYENQVAMGAAAAEVAFEVTIRFNL